MDLPVLALKRSLTLSNNHSILNTNTINTSSTPIRGYTPNTHSTLDWGTVNYPNNLNYDTMIRQNYTSFRDLDRQVNITKVSRKIKASSDVGVAVAEMINDQ